MRINELSFLWFLLAGFGKQRCDEANKPELKNIIESTYELLSVAPSLAIGPLEKVLRQYCFGFSEHFGDDPEAFQWTYVKWCYYWVQQAYLTVRNRTDQKIDDDEVMEVSAQLLKLARHPLVDKAAATEIIRLFSDIGNARINEVSRLALGLLDKSKSATVVDLLSSSELRERLAPLSRTQHRAKAVVELINETSMLLVFQHPNPKYGLVEREFPKGSLFPEVKVGDHVMIEIKTDSNCNVIEYNARPLPTDERVDDAEELDLPGTEMCDLASMNEWMDDKLRQRKLQPSINWRKNS